MLRPTTMTEEKIDPKAVERRMFRMMVSSMALWMLSKKARSGYELMKAFEEDGMAQMGKASRMYPLLRALEEKGLVRSKVEMTGRRKSYIYSITKEGQDALRRAARWIGSGLKGEFFREMSNE